VPFWVVVALLPALADDAAVLSCDTEPPSPGLSTRTETAVFDGSICVADESAAAPWSVDADWSAVWIGVAELSQPHDDPAWVCEPVWLVVDVLPASARDVSVLDCVTEPSLPGLSTRIGTLTLLG